jgi:hypothetical protein
MELAWNPAKDEELPARYGRGFKDIAAALRDRRLLANVPHFNVQKYPHQRMLVIEIENYAWVVPYVEDRGIAFLKTMYPSRQYTAIYLRGGNEG